MQEAEAPPTPLGSPQSASDAMDSLPTVRSPRPTWQEAILFFATFGFYTCFWMIGRVRDVKSAARTEQYEPWLWFFVPLIGLIQIIAMPKLLSDLTKLEQDHTSKWWKRLGWLWIAAFFFTTLMSNLMDSVLAFKAWLFLLVWLIVTALMSLLHARFNRWKLNADGLSFHSKPSGYRWPEWLGLSIGAPISLAFIYFTVIEPAFIEQVDPVADGQVISDEKNGYSLTLHGEGWHQVKIGSYSDGTALLELEGPLYDNYFLVYDWGVSENLNSATKYRIKQNQDRGSSIKCREERFLSRNQASVVSVTHCEGVTMGDPISIFSTFVETDERMLELYGFVSDTRIPYRKVMANMRDTAQQFAPL